MLHDIRVHAKGKSVDRPAVIRQDGIHHNDPVLGSLGGEHALERQALDLLVHHVAVAAGLGGKDDAAVGPLGGPGGALTGVAGALLAPGLLAAAGDLGPGQGALGALPAVGQVVLHHVMHDADVGLNAENALGQVDLGGLLLARHIIDVSLRHIASLLSLHSGGSLLRVAPGSLLRVLGDAGVGALAVRAAVHGAGLNVRINAAGLKDRALANRFVTDAAAIEARADEAEKTIIDKVNEIISSK